MSSITTQVRFTSDTTNTVPTPSDLLLPVFGGEVLEAFDRHNTFFPKVGNRTIMSGNTAKFPEFGRIGSEYHEAGVELQGLPMDTRGFEITLDPRPLASHFAVDDIDELLSHFEGRSKVARQCGLELANRFDEKLAILLVLASRTAAETGANGYVFSGGGADQNGTAYDNSQLDTVDDDGATAVLVGIGSTVVDWDELDVPSEQRYCAVKPAMWHQIRRLGFPTSAATLANRPIFGHRDTDMTNPQIAAGLQDKDFALQHEGVFIIRSNNLPNGKVINTGPTKYQGSFLDTTAIMWQASAIGAVVKMGITVQTEPDIRRGESFSVAKMLTGGGTIRPVCAVEFTK